MVKERTIPKFDSSKVKINKEESLMYYEDMVLGRMFEDKCAEMYYRGRMFGFVHLYNGQEAVSSGIIKSMRPGEDYVCSTYRDHVHALSSGVPAKEVMAELFGKATGCSKGRGGSMHMFSAEHKLLGGYAFIGEGIPVALGAAYQSMYRRKVLGETDFDQVTACFFGDGTTNNGQFFLNVSIWRHCGSYQFFLWWKIINGRLVWLMKGRLLKLKSIRKLVFSIWRVMKSMEWIYWLLEM